MDETFNFETIISNIENAGVDISGSINIKPAEGHIVPISSYPTDGLISDLVRTLMVNGTVSIEYNGKSCNIKLCRYKADPYSWFISTLNYYSKLLNRKGFIIKCNLDVSLYGDKLHTLIFLKNGSIAEKIEKIYSNPIFNNVSSFFCCDGLDTRLSEDCSRNKIPTWDIKLSLHRTNIEHSNYIDLVYMNHELLGSQEDVLSLLDDTHATLTKRCYRLDIASLIFDLFELVSIFKQNGITASGYALLYLDGIPSIKCFINKPGEVVFTYIRRNTNNT